MRRRRIPDSTFRGIHFGDGEPIERALLIRIEPEDAAQSRNKLWGGTNGPAAFEPAIPVGRDAGEFGHLLTPESLNPTPSPPREAALFRLELGPPLLQERAQFGPSLRVGRAVEFTPCERAAMH